MADIPLVVPFEYRKVGITTPEAAADYSADIIGFMACQRAHDSAERAEKEGRHGEAAFYRATVAVLLQLYDHLINPKPDDNPGNFPDPPELTRAEIDALPEWPAPEKKPKRKTKPKQKHSARKR